MTQVIESPAKCVQDRLLICWWAKTGGKETIITYKGKSNLFYQGDTIRQATHKKVALVSSVSKGSDSESFQLAVLIVCVRVQARAECGKIAYSMRVQIVQARVMPNNVGCNKLFDPRESR